MSDIDRKRLFIASCVAIATTGIVFSIRGDILDALGTEFRLTRYQLGLLLSPAFWGNTVANVIGGSIVDFVGMRRLFFLSTLGYVTAILVVLFTPAPIGGETSQVAFLLLYAGFLMFGLSQGLVEGVVNPLAATTYPTEKTHKLNVLHAWWPGGLIVGGVVAYTLTRVWSLDSPDVTPDTLSLGWRVKLAAALITPIAAALLVLRQPFPATERVRAGVLASRNVPRSAAADVPALVRVDVAHGLDGGGAGAVDSVPDHQPDRDAGDPDSHLHRGPGLRAAVLRRRPGASHVAHRAARRIVPALSMAGLYALGTIDSAGEAFVAATLFGVGTAYFWPTMLSVTSELFPRGGAFLLALMGGAGNLAIAFVLPVIGGWYDTQGAAAAFRYVAVLPAMLTVIFVALFIHYQSRGGYRPVALAHGRNVAEGAS